MTEAITQTSSIIIAGCGEMGLPMAKRLSSMGFNIKGFDVKPSIAFNTAGIKTCSTTKLNDCDVLISVVRDATETNALCFDQQSVFSGARYPKILVVCSTLKPSYIVALAEALPPDVELVDTPMSGASVAAAEGTLTFMLGGQQEVLDQLTPMFEAMGRELFRAGDVGAGMTLKVLNNYVAATSVVAVRRVLDVASRVGVSRNLLRETMSKSSGETWFGNRFEQIEWAREGYAADNTIGILEKDVRCALDVLTCDYSGNAEDRPAMRETEGDFDDALLGALRNMREQKKI